MSEKGFSKYETETLLTVRKNLLGSLEKVGHSIDAGSFHKAQSKGGSTPAEFGSLVLGLLLGVQEELDKRGHPLTW